MKIAIEILEALAIGFIWVSLNNFVLFFFSSLVYFLGLSYFIVFSPIVVCVYLTRFLS